MSLRRFVHLVALITTGLLTLPFLKVGAQQPRSVPIDFSKKDIAGVVASAKGPEAGVWVIAETTELPTKFARIVVTDDQGRYVLPDLPHASYQIFVRGYGLVDSARAPARPGLHLDLKAVVAPDGRAAARVDPANYWFGLMEIPKGPLSGEEMVSTTRACFSCHQVGDEATREVPKSLGSFTSSLDAWDHRMGMGPSGPGMKANFIRLGAQRNAFSDWSDRIAAGPYPKQSPPRPAGLELNLGTSMGHWAPPASSRAD